MATKVITGKVRASFVHIFEPQSVNGSEPKYSCSFIIPKSDTETIGKIREAVEQARQDGVTKWGGKIPPNLKLPPARRRHRPPRRSQLRQRLLRQRQQQRAARRGGPQARAHHRPAGGLFRLLCPGVDHLLPPSTPTATAASPADCRTSRSGATVSR